MTDLDPAALSSSLLARKGMAGVEGFAPPEIDPSRPTWSRSRTVGVVGLLMVAAAIGASGTWLTTQDREAGGSSSAAAAPPEPATATRSASAAALSAQHNRPVEILLGSTAPSAASREDPPSPLTPTATPEEAVLERAATDFVQHRPPEAPERPLRSAALTDGSALTKPKTPAPTGHVAAKAPPNAPSLDYRVQLHTLQSRDAIEREWNRLRRRHGDLLVDKQLVIDRFDVSGSAPQYRMQLGNLPTKTAARQLCRALSDRGQKCFLVPTS